MSANDASLAHNGPSFAPSYTTAVASSCDRTTTISSHHGFYHSSLLLLRFATTSARDHRSTAKRFSTASSNKPLLLRSHSRNKSSHRTHHVSRQRTGARTPGLCYFAPRITLVIKAAQSNQSKAPPAPNLHTVLTMASLAEQPFSLFPQQQDEYTHFAEPPHVSVYSSAPMDLSIPADAYSSYVQRAPSQELYTSPSTISYESSLYTADAAFMNGPTSPGYGDEYLPSSSLSSASAQSAPSSAVGSPLSNHGQIGMATDCFVPGLGIQPGIANADFVDFPFGAQGLDDMAFEFANMVHPKSFVGKSCSFLDSLSALLPVFSLAASCCLLLPFLPALTEFRVTVHPSSLSFFFFPSFLVSPPPAQRSKVAACAPGGISRLGGQ